MLGNAEMESQFWRAPLASPPAQNLGTGVASARPLPQAPHNVRLDGTLRRSKAGSKVLSMSSVGLQSPFEMSEAIAGAEFLHAAVQIHLPEILDVENGSPCMVEPSKVTSTT